MKKSEIYNLAMVTIADSHLGGRTKIEIIRQLIEDEQVAKFCEKRDEEEAEHGKSV